MQFITISYWSESHRVYLHTQSRITQMHLEELVFVGFVGIYHLFYNILVMQPNFVWTFSTLCIYLVCVEMSRVATCRQG